VGREGKDTVIYIDRGDFREVDDKSFYGLAPNKVVGLRYYQRVMCTSYETDAASGKVSVAVHAAVRVCPALYIALLSSPTNPPIHLPYLLTYNTSHLHRSLR